MSFISSFGQALKIAGLYVIPVSLVASDCIGSVYRVQGSSMQPSINPSDDCRFEDYVFVKHYGVRQYQPQRGDIVSFKSMGTHSENHIKRVIGLPGDVVKTRSYKNRFVLVPSGYLWIEGDNAKTSLDCNQYGPLPRGLIFGKASYIVWPPSRMGPVTQICPSSQKVKTDVAGRESRLKMVNQCNMKS